MKKIAGKDFFSDMNRPVPTSTLIALLVFFVTVLVYLPSLGNEFVNWDDIYNVVGNTAIRSLDCNLLKWTFSRDQYHSFLQPLQWISHAVDYALWGLNPLGHHLTSILFHALNSFLVVICVVWLLEVAKEKEIGDPSVLTERGMLTTATVAGLIFGLHPIHVETASWVSNRKDLLCTFFYLLSIIHYMRHVRRMPEHGALSRIFDRDYLFSLAWFVFSLASKVIAVTLPPVLIIMDLYYKRTKNARIVLLEKLPFFLLSIVTSLAMIFMLNTRGSLIQAPFLTRLTVGINSNISYLFKMIFPLNLNPFYPFPQNVSLFSPQYFVPVILTLVITVSLLAVYKRRRFLLAAWACYIVTLLPVIGIIHVGMESMADRYFYLPSLIPTLIAGVAFGLVSERVNVAKQNVLLRRVTLSASVLFILLTLTYITVKQIGAWKNSITLWNYVIENTPHQNFQRNPTAFINRGVAYFDAGDYKKAFKDFTRAIAVNSNYYGSYYYRGIVSLGQGLTDRAIDDFSKAIDLNPKYYEAINYRAKIYLGQGLTGKAIDDFSKAIALDPDNYETYNNRGISYGQSDALDKAIADFSKAISINHGYYEAYCNLGYAYYRQSRYDMAMENYNKAIELNRDRDRAYIIRAYARLKTGDTANAIADLRRGCVLGSDVGCRELKKLVKN